MWSHHSYMTTSHELVRLFRQLQCLAHVQFRLQVRQYFKYFQFYSSLITDCMCTLGETLTTTSVATIVLTLEQLLHSKNVLKWNQEVLQNGQYVRSPPSKFVHASDIAMVVIHRARSPGGRYQQSRTSIGSLDWVLSYGGQWQPFSHAFSSFSFQSQ